MKNLLWSIKRILNVKGYDRITIAYESSGTPTTLYVYSTTFESSFFVKDMYGVEYDFDEISARQSPDILYNFVVQKRLSDEIDTPRILEFFVDGDSGFEEILI